MRNDEVFKHEALHVGKAGPIIHIDLDRIRVLNPRSRNRKIFAQLVNSIATVGLKRPVTVTLRGKDENGPLYDLVCGQGRFEAFQILGEPSIPSVLIEAGDADRYLISLVENLARRHHSNFDLLQAVRILEDRGYTSAQIAQKTGLDTSYINCVLLLLREGEERLIAAVERGWLSIELATTIARGHDTEIQSALLSAYETGVLRGDQLHKVRRLVNQRQAQGKRYRASTRRGEQLTAASLLRIYREEVRRQRVAIQKAELNDRRLMVLSAALRRLFADEHFRTLLRAEELLDMPQSVAKLLHEEVPA
ncbi:plasmid partitioning protein RepB C-terminal domain-containing protein [Chitinimonas naiadis]